MADKKVWDPKDRRWETRRQMAAEGETPASHGQKVSKESADYVDHFVGHRQCHRCDMYHSHSDGTGTCDKVEGRIAATGHCKYWEPA